MFEIEIDFHLSIFDNRKLNYATVYVCMCAAFLVAHTNTACNQWKRFFNENHCSFPGREKGHILALVTSFSYVASCLLARQSFNINKALRPSKLTTSVISSKNQSVSSCSLATNRHKFRCLLCSNQALRVLARKGLIYRLNIPLQGLAISKCALSKKNHSLFPRNVYVPNSNEHN